MNDKEKKSSVTSDRLAWLKSQEVVIRTDNEAFTGKYIDSLLLGKTAFVVLNISGKAILINIDGIKQITQL